MDPDKYFIGFNLKNVLGVQKMYTRLMSHKNDQCIDLEKLTWIQQLKPKIRSLHKEVTGS